MSDDIKLISLKNCNKDYTYIRPSADGFLHTLNMYQLHSMRSVEYYIERNCKYYPAVYLYERMFGFKLDVRLNSEDVYYDKIFRNGDTKCIENIKNYKDKDILKIYMYIKDEKIIFTLKRVENSRLIGFFGNTDKLDKREFRKRCNGLLKIFNNVLYTPQLYFVECTFDTTKDLCSAIYADKYYSKILTKADLNRIKVEVGEYDSIVNTVLQEGYRFGLTLDKQQNVCKIKPPKKYKKIDAEEYEEFKAWKEKHKEEE